MHDIIRLLPDAIANQIAAGEVVQRPASVVKELLENAVDAGGNNVAVIVKEAGKGLIQVIDNGVGMSSTDARMSFERHATSKLKTSEDLFAIKTMGFRGEALASIAAVAQVEMKTKRTEDELGSLIKIEGSEIKAQEMVAANEGTSVSIKNLFYNVPARRNFLKSNPVEMRHIIDEFQRVALANSDISFSLYQNDMEVYQLKSGKLSQRIVGIFGKNYQQQLVPCKEETQLLKVSGYIGKPEHAKKTRGEQYFFVNQRFIKSNYLNHAVSNAYEGLIAPQCFPFYTLFLEIDPQHIDVNVHPTKTEIKFDDERSIYGIVRAAVKQALGAHNITPSLQFDRDVNFEAIMTSKVDTSTDRVRDRDYGQLKSIPLQKSNLDHWEKMYQESVSEARIDVELEQDEIEEKRLTFESAGNQKSTAELSKAIIKRSVFQIHRRYLVSQVKSGMMLVDQVAAHERVLFEKYQASFENQPCSSQQLLFPQTVKLNPTDHILVKELQNEIHALGFVFEEFGKSDVMVKGVPSDAAGQDGKHLFEGLVEQFKYNQSALSLPIRENLARSMARRAAIKSGQKLREPEMDNLIDQLFACENPNYAPNGKKTYFVIDLDQMESFLN
ncbi:MAG: DNA mismatch repair endonuclease MutL [Cyclobacteriaceae bacterium]